MSTIDRNFDIITTNSDLEHLYTFKKFPAFMGCVDQDPSEDIVNDMNIYISQTSGMIQVNPILPLEVVYQTEHNPGTTGQGWLDHHKALAEFIKLYSPRNVFEIGGAHGILSEYYREINPYTKWTILEPNPVPVENLKATMIKGFFTDDTVIPEGTDMIVHSHVLEHVYEPRKFLETLSKIPQGTKMCFSVPALRQHMQNMFTNVLNFEHTYFCTEEFIEWLLACYGFDLLDRTYFNNDHSVFYAVVRSEREITFWQYPEAYQENKSLFDLYLEYHQTLIRNINAKIAETPSLVYLFGAHVFSQFLLSFGLDRSKIVCIIDNSELKQGKRLYVTDLTVASPQILKDKIKPIVILRTGVFNNEIKNDILNNINISTTFLE